MKIRREHLLEDGYVQLGALSVEKLKGTIRVEFVSEHGLAEAGIDRTGDILLYFYYYTILLYYTTIL